MNTTLPPISDIGRLELSSVERSTLLSRYEIYEEVGRGGMGAVYRGRHRSLDRIVAIKVCLASGYAERFQREARLLASVKSPHIVTVHDFEQLADGRALLIMDWVAGKDLAQAFKEAGGPMPEGKLLGWMKQVCLGMSATDELGIIHRDLKPGNILLDAKEVARVADFGLARAQDVPDITHAGDFMGTPAYMAPEQAEDPRGVDTRCDIYSFGATFYHLATGTIPFEGETAFSILFKHKTQPLVAPRARNPALSVRFSDCLERCMAKSPSERFDTFGQVLESLEDRDGNDSAWEMIEDPAVEKVFQQFRGRRDAYLAHKGSPGIADTYSLPHNRSIIVQHGCMSMVKADALVSSDDDMISMSGTGLAARLLQVAGPTLMQEAMRYVPVRPGRAVVTSAGNLSARFVFHGITMGYEQAKSGPNPNLKGQAGIGSMMRFDEWKDATWIQPSRDLITEIMTSCFYHADTLSVREIAFPLLGTGVGEFPKDVCLDTTFRFLVRKLMRGLTTVREARIVIFCRS